MNAPKEVQPTGEFTCQLCSLTAPYTYYGQKPPNPHSIVAILYILLIILFSLQECSLFYSKRFCLPCVNENLKAFPLEIQEDMGKRKPQQKSFPCKKMDRRT
uniref:Cysteine-rich DPF motif domain-containing protein 1 n=1 Tax=Athene cunicularia TaxID=194338 RepID=A0A663M687_ATHCN